MAGLIGIIVIFCLIGFIFKVVFSTIGLAFKLVFWILGLVFSLIGWVFGAGLLVFLGFVLVGIPIYMFAKMR